MGIVIEKINHFYDYGTPFQTASLKEVSLTIEDGEFIGLIGHTGSGKSTLIQHLNGLIKPTSGRIFVDELEITADKVKLTDVRKKVGLVFQYPEYQLFEESVYLDIAFGPTNLGLSKEEIDRRVKDSMSLVGLDFEEYKDKSPFELSGGQKRRVAIAGVLAMEPEVLMLDEPTAGLDPKGRDEILGQIKDLQAEKKITVILVSHSMEDIAKLVHRIIVMDQGQIVIDGDKNAVFHQIDYLEEIGLGVPQVTYLFHALKQKGLTVDESIVTVEQAYEVIMGLLEEKNA